MRDEPDGNALHVQGDLCAPLCALFPGRGHPFSGPHVPGNDRSETVSPGKTVPACNPVRIEVLVDGSGDGHSIALFPDGEVFFSYERGASNNEAEFNAVILALENLPGQARACIRTDSQVVVWHLTANHRNRHPTFLRKRAQVEEIVAQKDLKVEIQWIPRQQNRADRFLKHYIASLCGANGGEPLYRRVRRLESENVRLRAKLHKAMKMLENRPVVVRDAGVAWDGAPFSGL